jgi:hypothetical protein
LLGRSAVDLFDGRFDLAVVRFREAVDKIAPDDPFACWWLAQALAFARHDDEAIGMFDRVVASGPSLWSDFAELERRALSGDADGVRAVVTERELLSSAAATDEYYPCVLASCLSHVGEIGEALTWLERASAWGFANHRFLAHHNRFLAPLRGDPRFQRLIDRVHAEELAFEVGDR